MNEKKMRGMVLKGPLGRAGHVVNVESHATTIGIPDIYYCIKGHRGWIELKFSDTHHAPKIRPSQIAWATKEINNGGDVWILAHIINASGRAVWLLISGIHIVRLAELPEALDWVSYAEAICLDKPNWIGIIDLISNPMRRL